jgi:hypothetical protein
MANRNYSYRSNLFGILEGKRKKVVEDEKRKTAQLEADLKLKTADIDSAARKSIFDLENLKASANTNMYLILGVVLVLVVGTAVYFKFRK